MRMDCFPSPRESSRRTTLGRDGPLAQRGTSRRLPSRPMSVLAIDAGTTGVSALMVTDEGRVAARGYEEFPQHCPRPGWVEHAPEEIWQATLAACRDALD